MTKYPRMTLLSAALAAFLLPSMAQTTNPPAQTTNPPAASSAPASSSPTTSGNPVSNAPSQNAGTIAEQKHNQQERIANGVKNGSLSPDVKFSFGDKEKHTKHAQKKKRE